MRSNDYKPFLMVEGESITFDLKGADELVSVETVPNGLLRGTPSKMRNGHYFIGTIYADRAGDIYSLRIVSRVGKNLEKTTQLMEVIPDETKW